MSEVGTANGIVKANSFFTQLYYAFLGNITSGKQRRGQAWMNALREVEPELYDDVTGTEADCFYDDRKLAVFKERVFGVGVGDGQAPG